MIGAGGDARMVLKLSATSRQRSGFARWGVAGLVVAGSVVAGSLGGHASVALAEPEKPLHGAATQAQVVEVLVRSKDVRDIRLDQGSDGGLKERQVFEIFRETSAYALPLSGNAKLRVNRELVARAVVYSVQPKTALARVFADDKAAKLEAKQIAVLNAAVAPPALDPYVRGASPVEKSPQAQAAWRGAIKLSLDVEIVPGRRSYFEWRAPGGGTFTKGTEIAPGVYRTVAPENEWIAPFEKKTYPVNVTIADSATSKPTIHSFKLESTGQKQQERATSLRVQRTFFEKKKFEGLRDVAFDSRNTLWSLDGTPGFTSHEYFRGTTVDGYEITGAEVTKGNFSALAVNDDYFFFLDLKDTCVKRYSKGGTLAQVLSSEALKIGESGSGNGRFKDPIDLAVLPDGGVVVLDAGQRCVHRFDENGKFVYSFGRPGEGDHDLKEPVALSVSHDGTVFVLDNGRKRVVVYKNGRVEKDDVEVGVNNEDLRGIAVDDFGGSIAILERNSGAIKIFAQTKDGWSNTYKSSAMGAEDVAALKKPSRIRMDAARVVYALDRDGESLARIDADRADFCGRMGNVELSDDVRLAATAEGSVVALDRSKSFALRFNSRGWATAKMGLESQAGGHLKTPVGVGVDVDASAFVLDAKKCELEKYQARGGAWLAPALGSETNIQKIRSGQMSSHREKFIVVMRGDKPGLGVMDLKTGDVIKYAATDADDLELGAFSGRFDAKDAKEEEGFFWLVDKSGERVSRFTLRNQTPTEVTQAFKKVTGIATNVAGAVFLCDKDARTIEIYAANGAKLASFTDESQLKSPSDVAADDLGRLYVFDEARIRIVELAE